MMRMTQPTGTAPSWSIRYSRGCRSSPSTPRRVHNGEGGQGWGGGQWCERHHILDGNREIEVGGGNCPVFRVQQWICVSLCDSSVTPNHRVGKETIAHLGMVSINRVDEYKICI